MKTEIMADMGLVYTYGQALAIVFIAGVICFILTVAGLRMAIVHAIPDCVKSAMTAGIGLFITIIGLKNAGLVVGNDATFVSLVDFAQWRVEDADPSVIRGAIVLIFIIRYGFMTLG